MEKNNRKCPSTRGHVNIQESACSGVWEGTLIRVPDLTPFALQTSQANIDALLLEVILLKVLYESD